MELGQKLKQARLEAGLSQRQLCGDEITRNMLSQIENGTARPSMDTLRFLAQRLGKTISYFLDENTVLSPNQAVMEQARAAFGRKEYDRALSLLNEYRQPDDLFDWEMALLAALSSLELAEQAAAREQLPYALRLLEQAAQFGAATPYFDASLARRRLLLLAQINPDKAVFLPADDRELLTRARMALDAGDVTRAAQYLDAAEDRASSLWNLLRGRAFMGQAQYHEADACLRAAEAAFPAPCAALLEQCCLAREDYKGAYEYALKQRQLTLK